MKGPAPTAHRSIRRHVLGGATALTVLVAGIGGWAATAELSGAVVASGVLVVDTNVKKVQHPTGGVVGELRVRDGKRVTAGDIVVRLDDTVTRANLAIVVKGLDELAARQARLETGKCAGTMPYAPRWAKSHFIAFDCGSGSGASGRRSEPLNRFFGPV